jgi:hypothetical protein
MASQRSISRSSFRCFNKFGGSQLGSVRALQLTMDSYLTLYAHVKLLVQERRQTLERIDLQHQQGAMSPGDYTNCRRALAKAIDELERLLQSMEETETAV